MTGPQRYKTIRGKRFEFDTSYRTKGEANIRANTIRRRDRHMARVFKVDTKAGIRYYVYRGPFSKKVSDKLRSEIHALRRWQLRTGRK